MLVRRVLIGLGNPGERYSKTRHNAGFWCIDAVAKQLDVTAWKEQFGGLLAQVRVGETTLFLFKPQQFMNLSGKPVRQLLDYYQIPVENICVAADEVYVKPGSARIRQGGADGGHNGWKSLGQHMVSDTYLRLRIGVGVYAQNPLERQQQPALDAYVLEPLPHDEFKRVEKLIDMVVPNLVQWAQHGQLEEETIHIN